MTHYYRSLPRKATTGAAEAKPNRRARRALGPQPAHGRCPRGHHALAGADLKGRCSACATCTSCPASRDFSAQISRHPRSFRDSPFFLRQIFIVCEEGEIAHHLDGIAASYPDVAGQLPATGPAATATAQMRLTLEGKDVGAGRWASDALALRLGPAHRLARVDLEAFSLCPGALRNAALPGDTGK